MQGAGKVGVGLLAVESSPAKNVGGAGLATITQVIHFRRMNAEIDTHQDIFC